MPGARRLREEHVHWQSIDGLRTRQARRDGSALFLAGVLCHATAAVALRDEEVAVEGGWKSGKGGWVFGEAAMQDIREDLSSRR